VDLREGRDGDGQDAAWVDRIQLPLAGFSIRSLGGVGTTLDHAAVTGDDRGGIAASSTSVFANGDTAAARFGIENLSGAGAMGQVMDGLVSDLRTETVYLLANNNTAISGGANGHVNTTVNRLLELTSLGTLSGRSIPLSHGIPVNGTNAASGPQCGVFAGYGQVVIYNRTNVFSISLPSGQVNDLGTMAEPPHVNSEGWAYWGVAEYFSNAVHVVHVSNPTTIARTQVPGGVTSTVSSFSNLGDMAGFTVSIPRGRWYYRYEGTSQFGTFPEALGFAGARFGGVSSGYFLSGGTARLLGNRVVLEFRGPPMTTAVLQGSTNMSAWSPLATNVLSPSGEWRYTNDMLGVPRRFFRAIIP
jgi:hypothetical protein